MYVYVCVFFLVVVVVVVVLIVSDASLPLRGQTREEKPKLRIYEHGVHVTGPPPLAPILLFLPSSSRMEIVRSWPRSHLCGAARNLSMTKELILSIS